MSNAVRLISDFRVSLEEAREYDRLGAQIKALEKRRSELQERFEPVLWAAGGSLQIGQYQLSITEQERESFSIKNAAQALGRATIEPFISRSAYTTLRVKVVDTSEDEAC